MGKGLGVNKQTSMRAKPAHVPNGNAGWKPQVGVTRKLKSRLDLGRTQNFGGR